MNCCCSGGRDGVTDVCMGNPADTLSGALVITVAPIGGFIRTGAPIKCHFKVKNINVNIHIVYSQILKKKWRWKKPEWWRDVIYLFQILKKFVMEKLYEISMNTFSPQHCTLQPLPGLGIDVSGRGGIPCWAMASCCVICWSSSCCFRIACCSFWDFSLSCSWSCFCIGVRNNCGT